ncbi:MAG: N-acetyltransferase [Pseudomonadota bacterium]
MFRILPETPQDAYEVEFLYDTSFAPGRQALSSYRLRDGQPPVADLCRTARDEYDAVVGAIRYWPVRIGPKDAEALLLGPVAVHPTRQGEGLAGLLIEGTLEAARATGWTRVILVGDAPYYGRFGFTPAPGLEFPAPTNPDRVLARALSPGAFDGVSGDLRPW